MIPLDARSAEVFVPNDTDHHFCVELAKGKLVRVRLLSFDITENKIYFSKLDDYTERFVTDKIYAIDKNKC